MNPAPRSMHLVAACAFLAVASSGCVTDPDGDGGEVVEPSKIKCPSWGCGSNSPVMGPWEFHELDADGAPNAAGVTLLGLYDRNGRPYQPEVHGAALIGQSLDPTVYPSIAGVALEGGYLLVGTPSGDYRIFIHKVSKVTPYWIGPDDLNETYELEYEDAQSLAGRAPLCNNPPDEGPLWPRALEAVVFAGDRYDASTKQVIATGERAGRWFNIGCAGSALAKLHLGRYTTAGSSGVYVTKPHERQALLKMYVSDVCGTGAAYTIAGEPLAFEDRHGWNTLTGGEEKLEALWSEDGALCLDEHRLEDHPDHAGITADLAQACAAVGKVLPKCSDDPAFPAAWPKDAVLLSANP